MSDLVPNSSGDVGPDYGGMHGDIVALLEAARHAAARSVNALMTASYWEIGRRIVEFEPAGQERAAYGQALLKRLSVDLTQRFGRGFSERNLEQMRLFYLAWPPERISQTPSAISEPTRFSQTVSGESSVPVVPESPIRTSATLSTLAQAFPLPWSAYVRLLSVKTEARREPSTKPKPCAAAGACASSTGRSTASSMNASPCRATRRPCCIRPRQPRQPSLATPSLQSRH